MKLPRMTTRRLMILVALSALVLAPCIWFIQITIAIHEYYPRAIRESRLRRARQTPVTPPVPAIQPSGARENR